MPRGHQLAIQGAEGNFYVPSRKLTGDECDWWNLTSLFYSCDDNILTCNRRWNQWQNKDPNLGGALTYGRRSVSLLTPHRLIRNCKVIRRLLLHFSLLANAFQAFSISGPGTSSPYCNQQNKTGPGRSVGKMWGCKISDEKSFQGSQSSQNR